MNRANRLRVIAGAARGRPLRVPRLAETRPTADLIKGVIFDMLEAEAYKRGFEPDEEGNMAAALAWPRVLDLFAGSGALGLEALSRGAARAVFVEHDADAIRAIQSNLAATELAERATLIRAPVASALGRVPPPIDLVLADPPYAQPQALTDALQALARTDLLRPTSVVVLEQPADAEPPPHVNELPLHVSRRHGRTRVTLYGASRMYDSASSGVLR